MPRCQLQLAGDGYTWLIAAVFTGLAAHVANLELGRAAEQATNSSFNQLLQKPFFQNLEKEAAQILRDVGWLSRC
jgi:hypothetical protein